MRIELVKLRDWENANGSSSRVPIAVLPDTESFPPCTFLALAKIVAATSKTN
jgi:hypothetical protein